MRSSEVFAKFLAGLFVVTLLHEELYEVNCDVIAPKNFTRSRYSKFVALADANSSETTATNASSGTDGDRENSNKSPLELALLGISNDVNDDVIEVDDFIEPVIKSKSCGEKIGENHPWIVVLEHSDPSGKIRKKTLSKGVLIDDQHVLTTVSSIYNSHPFWKVTKARLGDSPTWGAGLAHNRSEIVVAQISNIYHHQTKDIAIVRLANPVSRSNIIGPICLPPSDDYERFHNPELHRCVRPSVNAMARLPRISTTVAQLMAHKDCRILYERMGAVLTEDELCAWDDLGDTCTGDLGGPLATKINGRHHVIGLNSFLSVETDRVVGDSVPGVYTRVGSHLKWIEAVLNQS